MKRFILTTGPALLHEVPLKEVHNARNIYRINGAHGNIDDIATAAAPIPNVTRLSRS